MMNSGIPESSTIECVRFDNQSSFAGIFSGENLRSEPGSSRKESSLGVSKSQDKNSQNGSKEFLRVGPFINVASEDLTFEDMERIQVELESLLSHLSTRIRCVRRELGIIYENGSGPNGNSSNVTNGNGYHTEDSMDAVKVKTRKKSGSNSLQSNDSPPRTSAAVNGEDSLSPAQPSTSKAVFAVPYPSNGTNGHTANGENGTAAGNSFEDHDDSSGDVPYAISISSLDKSPKVSPTKSESGKKEKRSPEKSGRGKNRFHSKKGKNGVSFYRSISPSHFWDLVDDYCRELTFEDMELLEHVMDEHKPLTEDILKIPSLGPHYKGPKSPTTSRSARKRIETRSHDGWGPVTHRLVSALVEKRVDTYLKQKNGIVNGKNHDNGFDDDLSDLYDDKLASTGLTGLDDSGSPKNIVPVDTFVRKVLLDETDTEKEEEAVQEEDNETDEILNDINQTQCKLKRLQKSNFAKLQELHRLVEREVARTSAKQDLEKADKVLIEAYRVVSNSRSKKKPLSKREREVALRALERRRNALLSLQNRSSKCTETTATSEASTN